MDRETIRREGRTERDMVDTALEGLPVERAQDAFEVTQRKPCSQPLSGFAPEPHITGKGTDFLN